MKQRALSYQGGVAYSLFVKCPIIGECSET